MTDEFDAIRDSERVEFRCKVKFGPDGKLDHMALVTDFSENGLCIKTSDIYKDGTELSMLIESQGKSYEAKGVVMWAKKPPPGIVRTAVKCGMGVRFTSVDRDLVDLYNSKKD